MLDWPRPQLVRIVRGYLGLTGYTGGSSKTIAEPLTWLLCKTGFSWSLEADSVFHAL
jgi:hypothetical protein